ncbi:MAG: hypothetical protein ABI401_16080 [Candidatus Dormibacter sp.]
MNVPSQIRWIAATTLGLALGGSPLHFPGDGGFEWSARHAATGAILGAVSGIVAGLLQWLILRSVLRGLWRPVLSMAVALGFSHALGDGAPISLGHVPVAIAAAIVATGALALTYGERRPVALASSVVGWGAGLLIGYAVVGTLGLTDFSTVVVISAVTGLVWGALTAVTGFPICGASLTAAN